MKENKKNVVFEFIVEDIEFDYINVKKIIADYFPVQKFNVVVHNFEEIEFEEEDDDYVIEIMTVTYDELDEESFSLSLNITDEKTENSLKLDIEEHILLTVQSFENSLVKLLEIVKFSLERDYI